MRAKQIRQPAVSGTFYPADPIILALQVDRMLDQQPDIPLRGKIRALVSPHAGYVYSGPTAAAGYALLKKQGFRTAVIISPSHREYFNGISIFDGDAYRTPLGLIEVDAVLRERLLNEKGVFLCSRFGHREEHAIEVQLPFLQRISDDFKILPIVMGDQRREYCMLLGDALARALEGEDAVLIASSDLSHMYTSEKARLLDQRIATDIVSLSAALLYDDLHANRVEACGGGPVVAVMHAARQLGADVSRVLHQCNSGDVTGDTSRVVGYLSAALLQSGD